MKKISFSLILVSLLVFSSCKKSERKTCECISVASGERLPNPMPTPVPEDFRNDTTSFISQDSDCSSADAAVTITYLGDTVITPGTPPDTTILPNTTLIRTITCTEE